MNQKTAWNRLVNAMKVYASYDNDYDYVLYHLENEITLGGSEIGANLKDELSDDDILTQAIEHYGEPAQVVKAIEELAELTFSLGITVDSETRSSEICIDTILCAVSNIPNMCKDIITDVVMDRVVDTDEIVSELADVSIMLDQLRKIFDPTGTEFPKAREFKLQRLAKRITGDDSQ